MHACCLPRDKLAETLERQKHEDRLQWIRETEQEVDQEIWVLVSTVRSRQ